MIIYPEKKIIFHHVPKTAGKSIRKYFKECFGNHVSTGPQHQPLKYCYDKKYDDYKIFTVIRNPYERLCSFYEFRKNKFITGNYNIDNRDPQQAAFEMSFNEWIYNWVIPKSKSSTWHNDTSISNSILIDEKIANNLTIIRFENLHKELFDFFEKHNIPFEGFPHRNKGNKRDHWSTYFNKDLKEVIYQWDKFVFDNFYPHLKGV